MYPLIMLVDLTKTAPEESYLSLTYYPPEQFVTRHILYLLPSMIDGKQKIICVMQKPSFFRFLVSLVASTQDITREKYYLVPIQDCSKFWTDEELYARYGLTAEEIAFIEKRVRPMPSNDNGTAGRGDTAEETNRDAADG